MEQIFIREFHVDAFFARHTENKVLYCM